MLARIADHATELAGEEAMERLGVNITLLQCNGTGSDFGAPKRCMRVNTESSAMSVQGLDRHELWMGWQFKHL